MQCYTPRSLGFSSFTITYAGSSVVQSRAPKLENMIEDVTAYVRYCNLEKPLYSQALLSTKIIKGCVRNWLTSEQT